MTHTATNTSETFARLADLLDQASQLARQLSQVERARAKQLSIPIPKLERPKHVPRNEEWFWSEEWQRGEREVNAALANGDYLEFESVEALLADLHARV